MFAAFVPTLPLCAGTFRVGPVCKHRVRCVPRVCVRAMKMAATVATEEKMLHAVYRVGNMERTGEFLKALGMSCLRQRDIPEEKYSNAFYGYGTESRGKHFALELTYNYGVDSYKVGNAFAGFRVTLPDLEIVKSRLTQAGFNPMNLDDGSIKVVDPTGYEFQVKEGQRRDPMSGMTFYVKDINNSIKFYKDIGMTQHTDNVVSYGDANDTTVLELNEFQGETYDAGDGYGQIAVSTMSVYDMAERLKSGGIKVTRDPGPVPGIGTKITAARDPDNFKVVFVDANDFELELN